MNKTCNIYLTTREGLQLAAVITLAGTEVSARVVGGKLNLGNILNDAHLTKDKKVTLQDDPVAWFNSLPTHYSGSYMRAEMA